MRKSYLNLFGVILASSLTVLAQGSTKEQIEANKRMAESLRNPTFIRLRLVFLNPNTDETSVLAPLYKSGDRIALRLILNHSFDGPITFTEYLNLHRDQQLELLREGELVPYSDEVQQDAERARKQPPNESSAVKQFLPATDYVLQRINPLEWYKTLAPGHYELRVKRRFVWDGAWVTSDPISFEVVPTEL